MRQGVDANGVTTDGVHRLMQAFSLALRGLLSVFLLLIVSLLGAAPGLAQEVLLDPPSGTVLQVEVGQPFSQTFTASGYSGEVKLFLVMRGGRPQELTTTWPAVDTVVVSGTLAQAGIYELSIAVMVDGRLGYQGDYRIEVAAPEPLTLDPPAGALADGEVGTAYSETFTASGGSGNYSFAVTDGALPGGLTLAADGTLSGRPTTRGSASFTVTATDTVTAQTASAAYTLLIERVAVSLDPPAGTLPDGEVGQPYSQAFTVSGTTGLFRWIFATVPHDLRIRRDGEFTTIMEGTPTTPGTYTIGIHISQEDGQQLQHIYTLRINPAPLTLDPAAGALADGEVGRAYRETFTADGGSGNYTFAVTAGALPGGLTLDADGTLSGTPTTAESASFTVTASDVDVPANTGSAAYTLAVAPAPANLALDPPTGALSAGQVGAAYSQRFVASGGSGSYSFGLYREDVPLPPGLDYRVDGEDAVVLQGTPTEAGSYTFYILLIDAVTGNRVVFNYSLTIAPAPVDLVLDPPAGALTAGEVGAAYSQTFTADGGSGNYTFAVAAGALPDGLTLDADGTLSGTPTTAESASFTVTASDVDVPANTGAAAYTLVVVPTPVVLMLDPPSGTLTDGEVGVAFSQRFDASGGSGSYGFAFDRPDRPFPPGLNHSGGEDFLVVDGTPTEAGNFTFDVTLIDAVTSDTATFKYSLRITPARVDLVLDPPAGPLTAGEVGAAYTQIFTADGGSGNYTFAVTAGALPGGLTLDADGALSGTPTTAGTASFTVTASDVDVPANSGTAAYTLIILPVPVDLVLDPPGGALTAGEVGAAYSQTFTADGGSGNYTFTVTAGALPTGLMLDANGTLSGIPMTAESASFTITASDVDVPANSGAAAYTLTIVPAPVDLVLDPPAGLLTAGEVGKAYSEAFTADGGSGNYTFVVTAGALPDGLKLDADGTLSGTPTTAGTASFTVTASDIDVPANSGAAAYTLAIAPALSADATLSALSLSGGPLDPPFKPGTTSYAVSVPNATSATAVTPTSADANAMIEVNGSPVASGTPSGSIPLNIGPNTIIIEVTAEDGVATAIYMVTVTRASSDNADLAGLTISEGSLSPAFSPATTSYTVSVDNAVTHVEVAAAVADPAATITINGAAVASGMAVSVPLGVGETAITLTVTAEDGSVQTYTVTVTRAASANAALSGLVPSTGTLTPGFSESVVAYDVEVANEVETITLTPTAADTNAMITVNGSAVASGTASAPLTLMVGPNPVAVMVTAQDGTTRIYSVTVMRAVIVRPDPSLDPEVIGLLNAQANTAMRFAQTQMTNFHRRLEQLHNEGERRASSMDIRLAIIQNSSSGSAAEREIDRMLADRNGMMGAYPGSGAVAGPLAYGPDGRPVSTHLDPGEREERSGSPLTQPDLGPFAVWTGGFVNFGERDRDGLDLGYTMVGVSGGIDYRFSPQFVGGLGVGYGRDRTDIGSNGSESRATAFSGAFYASYKPMENLFIDGLIGGSRMDFESTRFVSTTGDLALGSRSGTQLFGSLTAAYEFRDKHWLISPYGRIEASRSWLDGFTEEGGGIYGLIYGNQTIDTLSGVLGIRASHSFDTQWGILTPGVRAEYTHDFAGSSRATIGYTDLGTLPYAIDIDPTVRDHLTLGLTLDVQFNDDVNLGFDYRTRFGGSGNQDHAFGAKLGVRF